MPSSDRYLVNPRVPSSLRKTFNSPISSTRSRSSNAISSVSAVLGAATSLLPLEQIQNLQTTCGDANPIFNEATEITAFMKGTPSTTTSLRTPTTTSSIHETTLQETIDTVASEKKPTSIREKKIDLEENGDNEDDIVEEDDILTEFKINDNQTLDPDMANYLDQLENTEGADKMKDLVKLIGEETDKREKKQLPDAVFMTLIKSGKFLTFISHLRRGKGTYDINASDVHGRTALMYAIKNNSPSAIRAIFKYASDLKLNQLAMNGLSALHVAVEEVGGPKDSERLEVLLNRPEIDINVPDDVGRTPLHKAIERDRKYAFDLLLKQPTVKADIADEQGVTPLELAVSNSRACYIKPLIGAGANTKQLNKEGLTPLFISLKTGDSVTIRLLLDAMEKARQGKLDDLRVPAYFEIQKPQENPPPTSRPKSTTQNSMETKPIPAPEDDAVNIKDPEGNTPLHFAASGLSYKLINALVKAGARLDIKNKNGETPYDIAVNAQQGKKVENLLRCTASR